VSSTVRDYYPEVLVNTNKKNERQTFAAATWPQHDHPTDFTQCF